MHWIPKGIRLNIEVVCPCHFAGRGLLVWINTDNLCWVYKDGHPRIIRYEYLRGVSFVEPATPCEICGGGGYVADGHYQDGTPKEMRCPACDTDPEKECELSEKRAYAKTVG